MSVNFVYGAAMDAPDGGGLRPVGYGTYAYFQHFRPTGRSGYSILLYDISLEQANEVRAQLRLAPLKQVSGPDAP